MDDKVKDLLDRIRSTAAGAADSAQQTARVAGKRAGQMVDVAKLNVQLFDLSGEYNDVLRQLGEVMYQAHKGESQDEDKVSQLLVQADELAGKIAELKERIAALRQSRTCPSCGAVCGKDDQFCRRCGGSL